MHEEAAYELHTGDVGLPPGFLRLSAPGREGNGILVQGEDPAVGDGNPVCIAPQVLDGVKGLLDEWAPVLCIKDVPEFPPLPGILAVPRKKQERTFSW